MLKEYLYSSTTTKIKWHKVIQEFDIYHIEMQHDNGEYPIMLETIMDQDKIEIFLCFHGSIMLEPVNGAPIMVNTNEIFFLGNVKFLHTARINTPLSGILIVIDAYNIEKIFNKLNQSFFNNKLLDASKQTTILDKKLFLSNHACCIFEETEWSHSFFSALDSYKFEKNNQSNYLLLKLFELFYLIHTDNSILKNKILKKNSDSYIIQTVNHVKEYMDTHLTEHLTIDFLSEKFHISATTLKSTFRKIYGQPIHRWLQIQRIKHAATLLYTSNMTVLQVAQSVGYEGSSQFNVIFKRYYGITPGQYRKMSNSIKK